jgi:hypothetical protein
MKKILPYIFILLIILSCKNQVGQKDTTDKYIEIINEDYELTKPTADAKAVLVLFGEYTQIAEDIKREFDILELAKAHNIAVLYMNFNQKLWLETSEKGALAKKLQGIFNDHKLPIDKVYIGGFSSGGNVAFLVGNLLTASDAYNIVPKGIFIVDSPLDLAELYNSSNKSIQQNPSNPSEESVWLKESFGKHFGIPDKDIAPYEGASVYTLQTENIENISALKQTKIRLYTEPDTVWWKENRMADYDQMNAYPIKELSKILKKSGFTGVEYLPTDNKGYRANGQRHPHSWSIVDKQDLINWMLK